MAYDNGALRASLAAAVGDDPALVAELREAFRESAVRHIQALAGARDTESWRCAGLKLKSLAASFGARHLLGLAEQAAAGTRDLRLVQQLRDHLGAC